MSEIAEVGEVGPEPPTGRREEAEPSLELLEPPDVGVDVSAGALEEPPPAPPSLSEPLDDPPVGSALDPPLPEDPLDEGVEGADGDELEEGALDPPLDESEVLGAGALGAELLGAGADTLTGDSTAGCTSVDETGVAGTLTPASACATVG